MGIIVGLLAGQAVISEEVASFAHVLARSDVAGIIEVAHSRGVLFHWLFADEHGDGLERTVLHTRYITLHGQCSQPARHQPNCSPLGGFHRVTDKHANAVVGLLVQVFHCTVLVAAAFQDDKDRSIERGRCPFGQLLRLGQSSKKVVIKSVRGDGRLAPVSCYENTAQGTVLGRDEFLDDSRVLIAELGESLGLVNREDDKLRSFLRLGIKVLHMLVQAGVILGRHLQRI